MRLGRQTDYDITPVRSRGIECWTREELQIAASLETPPAELLIVTPGSSVHARRAVETIARYFRREFRYDFVPFNHANMQTYDRAFLWSARGWYPRIWIGACGFLWVDDQYGKRYSLEWIWLHPFCRRQRLLTAAWPYFRGRFGDFEIARPLSPAMCGFLDKVKPITDSVCGGRIERHET